ncbi:c-type cytochrome biogenesis protein CcmI [Azospirillum agricola]|uniref:c-type cytochrome biogenesis protein CcmI n=1 Tax=Azospirillum agricola TaxID=1720247 RepID=UPI000A0EFA11|nr:c-type cytochrome biogenesis protein CcmI [Azospirillum agricola]SMH55531.1 cytochrome c-type biogenesis protein CcmH [Azospirillum lipoferum]
MLFWILAAALTVAVLLLILPPLLKPADAAPARDDYDREVYRDQLDELERDLARGVISPAQAEAAKAEIGRRMLATAQPAPQPAARPARSAKALAMVLALTVPVGALAVYGAVGRPDQPARPLASRNLEQERGGPPKSVLAAIDKLKQQLAESPDDAQGWAILGQAYVKMNRPAEAADALRRAVALNKDDLELLGLFAETLTEANDGTVPEEARAAFDGVLARDPKDARARFFAALARHQAGDQRDALERWRALLAESPANAAWVPTVQAQIREAAIALNLDPAAVTPNPLPAEETPATAQAQGQPQQQPSAEEREQMVRGMVDGLAARLAADPSDIDGWVRLVRSYNVLGEPAKALEAARKARERAPDRPDVLVVYASSILQNQPRSDPPAPMPEEATAALRKALAGDATNRDALWLLGLDAMTVGRKAEATDYWTRLIAQFQPNDPEYALLKTRLDALKTGS